MILALEAGYAKGGDKRWGNLQSAAIKIADPNNPGRGNDHIALAIEVGENPDPVAEMKRIYLTTGRRLGYRSFSRVEGPDVVELKRMLHTLGYWRPTLAAFPDQPPPSSICTTKKQSPRWTSSARTRVSTTRAIRPASWTRASSTRCARRTSRRKKAANRAQPRRICLTGSGNSRWPSFQHVPQPGQS